MNPTNSPIDVLGFGHCCMDYLSILAPYPEKGKKGIVRESLVVGGGPVPIAIATLAKFGLTTRFIGKVGTDADGIAIVEGLRSCNVDVSRMIFNPNVSTPRANIWIDHHDGSRTIALDTTGYEWMRPDELGADSFDGFRFVLCDGRAEDATLKGLRLAKEGGAMTILDTGSNRDRLDEILPLIDYAVVSQDLADYICPRNDPGQLALHLLHLGAKNVVVTCGADGTIWKTENAEGHVPAYPVRQIVDTTGAGDIFHGGFVYGLFQGWDIERSIQLGSAAASLSCEKLSGIQSVPTLEEALTVVEG